MKPINSKRNSPLNLNSIPLELRLLLSCLRASAGLDEGDRINALCRTITDWDAFIRQVNRHQVVSPAYKYLKRYAGNSFQGPVFSDLKDRYRKESLRTFRKAIELIRIVKRFDRKGILVLPIKGPVVALQAWGDLGSRHVGDLDILVSPEQTFEAENILLRDGYRRIHPHFELTPRQRLAYIHRNHHFGYSSRKRGVMVELHWRFGSNRRLFPFKFDELWQTRETLKLGGVQVSTLSPEHTILLLCAHGSGHAWSSLFWLNDVAQLVAKYDALDWRVLMGRAEQSGIARMVAEGVLLASVLLGSPLPDPVRSYIRKDKGVNRIAGKAFYLMNHSSGLSHKPFTYPWYCTKSHQYMLRRDPGYKLTFFANMLGADYGNWGRVPLPDALFPLYYLLRPVTWFFRWFIPKTKIYREGPMGRG